MCLLNVVSVILHSKELSKSLKVFFISGLHKWVPMPWEVSLSLFIFRKDYVLQDDWSKSF